MQNFKNLLHAWRHTLYTLAYFALLAVFVPMASKRHMGTGGMFFAMALAAVLLLTCWGSIKLLSWKIAQSQITAAERRSWLSGAALLEMNAEDEDLSGGALVAVDPTTLGSVKTRQVSTLEQETLAIVAEEEQNSDILSEQDSMYLSDRLNIGSHTLDLATMYEQILVSEQLVEGKGNLTYVLAEELGGSRLRLPVLLVDFGSFHTLLPELSSGFLFGNREGCGSLSAEVQKRLFPLERKQAEMLGEALLRERLQVIFRFRSYNSSVEASAILLLILQGMRKWQLQLMQQQEFPQPCIVILGEAHRLLPHHDAYSVARDDPATVQLLRRNLLAYLKAKGSYGLHLYLVTGQVSALHQAALDACGIWLIRQPPPSELRRLHESTGLHHDVLIRVQQDQALLVDRLTKTSFSITVRPSFSLHEPEVTPPLMFSTSPRRSMEEQVGLATTRFPIQIRPVERFSAEQISEELSSNTPTPYSEGLLAYVSYLYSINWLTPTAIRRVPDPLFDLAKALGLDPVKGQDLMNRQRALNLREYVLKLSKEIRAHYLALARPHAPTRAPRPRDHAIGHDPPANGRGWRLPSLAVLLPPPDHTRARQVSEETLEALRHTVLSTLHEQRVEADVLRSNICVGSRVIRLGISPKRYPELTSDGKGGRIQRVDEQGHTLYKKTKVSQITTLEKDLKLALAVRTLRMQAPVPGSDYVGIEIPNPVPTFVTFYEVFTSAVYQEALRTSRLVIALGKDVAGRVRVGTIKPHLLLAGQTGSGKSVGINTIIGSLLMNASPEEVCLLMVDPKRVEFTKYQGIPHLLAPVITEVEQVKPFLEQLILEMENRYRLFEEAQVRNLEAYEKKRVSTPSPDLGRLPIIIVIIDELADLMMSGTKGEMETLICRLAQKARAAGIHLVLGTQRPTVDVVTGNIKANMPVRIAYRVASGTDARTIMDEGGADSLLGQGDLLYLTPEAGGAERMQGALLSDAEIDAIVAHWTNEKERCRANGIWEGPYTMPARTIQLSFDAGTAVPEQDRKSTSSSAPRTTPASGEDVLLTRVIAHLTKHAVVSVDMLKRGEFSPTTPRMGHERACAIRDALIARGLIGPYTAGLKGHPVVKVTDQDASQQEISSREEAARP